MTLKNIAIVGANGMLGPAVLNALITANTFKVTVLTRENSKSTYPSSVNIIHVSHDPSVEELVRAFQGQDAIVVTFAGSNDDLQIRYADAAAQAEVKRFIPADFGSCDSDDPYALELIPLYRAKQRVRRHLQDLAQRSGLTWTSLVTGHFFDVPKYLGFDLEARRVTIFGDGKFKSSSTTRDTIGLATVRVLQREQETTNKMLYIQSLCVTQNEILNTLEQVQGHRWSVKHVSTQKFIDNNQAQLRMDPGDTKAYENMVAVVGTTESNWEGKNDFANPLLGLEQEDLSLLIKKMIDSQPK